MGLCKINSFLMLKRNLAAKKGTDKENECCFKCIASRIGNLLATHNKRPIL